MDKRDRYSNQPIAHDCVGAAQPRHRVSFLYHRCFNLSVWLGFPPSFAGTPTIRILSNLPGAKLSESMRYQITQPLVLLIQINEVVIVVIRRDFCHGFQLS